MRKINDPKWGEGQKMKILALGPNSSKFCIHNLGAYRELEMQKLSTQIDEGGGGLKMKIPFATGIKTVGRIFIKVRIWFRCLK